MIRSAAYLLIRREPDTHLAVLDLRMCQQVLHRRYDLCDTGFVVGSQQGCMVGHDNVLPFVSRIDIRIVAVVVFDNTRFHIFSTRIRRRIHMRNKTNGGAFVISVDRQSRGHLTFVIGR